MIHFYPRPPRGGRRACSCAGCRRRPYFYPRPPRGGRHARNLVAVHQHPFLSTPSARRATRVPRFWIWILRFLSTPSARRATHVTTFLHIVYKISIHALREEGDLRGGKAGGVYKDFYPRPPRGGRHLVQRREKGPPVYFYPRPPRGGRPTSAAIPPV